MAIPESEPMADLDIRDARLLPYAQALQEAAASGQARVCRAFDRLEELKEGPWLELNGKRLLNFSSNDYLGLSQHPTLKRAAQNAVERWGTGSTASRLICGTFTLVQSLEEALAGWKQTEAALVFSSGYQANVAILQAIVGPKDWLFCDKLNHASLVDGCRLSGANWVRYRHLDLAHLEQKLQTAPPEARKWIVTDSVFSMDGDYPDLMALANLADRYNALILVDEAHATGLYGERGSGLCEAMGVGHRVALQMGTFSKALGGAGAYVAGSRVLIDYLINHARGFIYSTAPAPATIGAAMAAIQEVQTNPDHKARLLALIAHAEKTIQALGLADRVPLPIRSPIIPVLIGESALAMRVSERLMSQGFYVQAIRPPTVPPKTARLRIALSAAHTESQVESLFQVLKIALDERQ